MNWLDRYWRRMAHAAPITPPQPKETLGDIVRELLTESALLCAEEELLAQFRHRLRILEARAIERVGHK